MSTSEKKGGCFKRGGRKIGETWVGMMGSVYDVHMCGAMEEGIRLEVLGVRHELKFIYFYKAKPKSPPTPPPNRSVFIKAHATMMTVGDPWSR